MKNLVNLYTFFLDTPVELIIEVALVKKSTKYVGGFFCRFRSKKTKFVIKGSHKILLYILKIHKILHGTPAMNLGKNVVIPKKKSEKK